MDNKQLTTYGSPNNAGRTIATSWKISLSLNLPKAHAAQELQSLCLFLQVSMLLKIINHCGTTILPIILSKTICQCATPLLINTSILQYPQQPSPRPQQLKQSMEIITWLYLVPNTYNLQNLLGLWTEYYDLYCKWGWKFLLPNLHAI